MQLAEHVHARAHEPVVREITDALTALFNQVNAAVPGYERLAFLAVARDRWSVEGGLLTPTLKIRRTQIEERYAPLLERWYASKQTVIWEQ